MNVFETLQKIEKIKSFQKKEVDDKLIGIMLYHAAQTISAGNMQEWVFIVVKDEKKKKMLYEATLNQKWILEAPVNIVVCADLRRISDRFGVRGERLYAVEDTSFAALSIALAAVGLGLGSYVVQTLDEEAVKIALRLPDHIRPILIVSIGYPAEEVKKQRFNFENLTWVDEYGKKYEISYHLQPGVTPSPATLEELLKKSKTSKKIIEKLLSFFGIKK